MKIKNYTPHQINIRIGDNTITIAPEPSPIRIGQKTTQIKEIMLDNATIPVYNREFVGQINLPEIENDTIYVVSSLVYEYIKNNYRDKIDSFVIPGEPIRDKDGNIIGCNGLNVSI